MFRAAAWALPLLTFLCAIASSDSRAGATPTLYVTLYPIVELLDAPQYCATPTSDAQVTATAGDRFNQCFLIQNDTSVTLNHHELWQDGTLLRTIDLPLPPGRMETAFEERIVAVQDQDVTYTLKSFQTPGGMAYVNTARVRVTARAARISLSRDGIDVEASEGALLNESLTISNVGEGALTWHLGESAKRAATRNGASPNGSGEALLPAYAVEEDAGEQHYILFDLQEPLVAVPIPAQLDGIRAGAFADNDFSRQFLLSDTEGLLSVDTRTGETTVVNANVRTIPIDQGWRGLTWDPVSRSLYGLSATDETATLYKIDPAIGAGRLGEVNIIRRALRGVYGALAADSDGRFYAIDVDNDLLIRVVLDRYNDPGHVSGYTIGPLGFDVDGIAGLTVDPADNTLYLSAHDAGTGLAGMYTIDTERGTATLTQVLDADTPRIAMAAATAQRPCNIEQDVAWLSLSPYASRPIAAGASQEIAVFLDARHLSAGVYETYACVHSNDLARSKIPVPVRFTVVTDEPLPPAIFADGFEAMP